jgi:hypothetical protein
MSVESFDGFAEAIRTKLEKEIRCPKIADAFVLDEGYGRECRATVGGT